MLGMLLLVSKISLALLVCQVSSFAIWLAHSGPLVFVVYCHVHQHHNQTLHSAIAVTLVIERDSFYALSWIFH